MKLLLVAVSALAVACASAAPEAPAVVAPAQAQTADVDPSLYSGTYRLQGNRGIDLRVWLDADGRLTTFRPTSTAHKFLHETRDDVRFVFTIKNGRATAATMNQAGREISGPRTQ